MTDEHNTVFLRLEGPLQAWGDNSKFVIRRTMDAPTKSGVIGLICCAMGVRRDAASQYPIPEPFIALRDLASRLVPSQENKDDRPRQTILGLLNTLEIGVRIDRPGTRWWDYHTVGAGYGILTAEGKIKRTASTGEYETLISRREYLCDASFLVALRGAPELINEVVRALQNPKWSVFLGRKSCPPGSPVMAVPAADESWTNPMPAKNGLPEALEAVRWRPRYRSEERPDHVNSLIEWQPRNGEIAPPDAEVWYDTPISLDPPVHEPRLVQRIPTKVLAGKPLQEPTQPPQRSRADYSNTEYKKRRKLRLESDHGLCVFCKSPATTVQHITYRRAGGNEEQGDLRSLCRLCHDAVTMIEYGLGMGLDRINPEESRWRQQILQKRAEIIAFRSLETRRRRLQPEEVE